jgi:F-type H+-transporting ATPase subunit epsilon
MTAENLDGLETAMATFQFDLVSPEKLLFSGEVDQVDVPGSEGDFGVLAGHAPMVTTLRPGILTVFREGGALKVVVSGGFAEVGPTGLTVLADTAAALDDFDRTALAGSIKTAEDDVANAKDDWQRDKLLHRLDQLKALQAALGAAAAPH